MYHARCAEAACIGHRLVRRCHDVLNSAPYTRAHRHMSSLATDEDNASDTNDGCAAAAIPYLLGYASPAYVSR